MFNLTDELVSSVEIDGRRFAVDMSFDNILRLHDMLNDDDLSDEVQIKTGIQMLFRSSLNAPIKQQAEIFNEAYKALIGGDSEVHVEYDLLGNPMPTAQSDDEDEQGQLYCFKQDAEYIYASFLQDYGIDLIEQQGHLHWYKFKALLTGLSETTKFKKVLEIRQMPLPKNGKARSDVEKMKKIYALKGEVVSE